MKTRASTSVRARAGDGGSSGLPSPRISSILVRHRNGSEHEVRFDEADRGIVEAHRWNVIRPGKAETLYALTVDSREYMHRLLLGCAPGDGQFVDHADGNGLHNCRRNLRLVTRAQQNQNRAMSRSSANRFKGVTLRASGRWQARIAAHGGFHHLGMFPTEVEAARAYNDAARRLHGEFARLNEIPAGAA